MNDKIKEMKVLRFLKFEGAYFQQILSVGGLHYALILVFTSLCDPTPKCDMPLTNSIWQWMYVILCDYMIAPLKISVAICWNVLPCWF